MVRPNKNQPNSTELTENNGINGLKFNKPIITTIKQSISNKELLKRVSQLHEELSVLQDENLELHSLDKITKDLINSKLLNNSSIGVQAFVCCCISDILRIYAPNAPYSEEELSLIFKAFFKQFSRIANTKIKNEKPQFYVQYVYLLKRLAETKSSILMIDLPDSQNLIEELFDTFFNLATKDSFPQELTTLVTDILSEMVSESETIPNNIIKLILSKFNNHESNNLNNTISPEFNFSLSICENNVDRMSRLVAQHFSEILYHNSNKLEIEDETEPELKKRNEKEFQQAMEILNQIHQLSFQLWRFIPSILSSVMALIEDELNASDDRVRVLATKTIGQMLGCKVFSTTIPLHKVNFFIIHKTVWSIWLKKSSDISPQVRISFVQSLPNIISNNQFVTSDICTILSNEYKKCLLDTDQKVRDATCTSLSSLSFPNLLRLLNNDILQILFQLIREKVKNIRVTSINLLSSIYQNYIQQSDDSFIETAVKKSISEIPNQILSLIYINDKNITALVDFSLFEKLVPLTELNSVKRVDTLLQFYSSLNEKGKEAFLAINKRQQQVSKVIKNFMDLADETIRASTLDKENEPPSSETIKTNMSKVEKIINWFCNSFPDDHNTYQCLLRLFQLNRARFFQLISNCIAAESDIKTIVNSRKELSNKISDAKNIKLDNNVAINTSDMVFNIDLLILRGSPILYNKSNVDQLIHYSKNSKHEYNHMANELLEQFSNSNAEVFKSNVRSLMELCTTKDDTNKSGSLKTIYHFIKSFPDLFPQEISFTESLKNFAIEGKPDEAKYAMKLIGLSSRKEDLIDSVLSRIYPFDFETEKVATHLSTIAELFLVDKYSVSDKELELTPNLIKNILLQNFENDKDENLKLLTIRLLINILKSHESSDNCKEKAAPVLKLLISIIGNKGEIVNENDPTWPTSDTYKAKLRLQSGLYLLKLAKLPVYNEVMLSPTLRILCFLLVDDNELVKTTFSEKLKTYLANESISEKYLSLMFFATPDNFNGDNNTLWLKSMFKRSEAKKDLKFEKSLVRLTHNITHHEKFVSLMGDYSDDSQKYEAYEFSSTFLVYYVQLIAKPENISLLYYLVSRIKQYRDASISSSEYDKNPKPEEISNLYRVSELAQLILKIYSDLKNWSIQTWSDKLKLPQEIYAPMGSAEEAQSIVSTIFIPESIQSKLIAVIKKSFSTDSKRRNDDNRNGTSSKRQKLGASTTMKKRVTFSKSKTKTKTKTKTKAKPKKVIKTVEPTRKSSRIAQKVNYKDQLSSSEDEEMEDIDEEESEMEDEEEVEVEVEKEKEEEEEVKGEEEDKSDVDEEEND
ncbi:PDS5 [Candida pseudojiufengensis]|uniref:PDS5 n=1 Tax=Candida pseudojiufengensis TaxID=497109 RepID=UPI002223FC12|nr:PDS5 [Candida pseudojiufengensis]KAI5966449.1 PDS5 [Candida pseudojiufengensis]